MAAQGRRDGHGGRPEERVGCGPKKDCTWGLGQPGGGRGLPETCVLVTECGVYHLFLLSWPSARTPPPSSGRARPKGWSTGLHGGQALPCGTWDLRGGWQAGPRGRTSWQHRPLHAACRGPWPAPRHRGVWRPPPPLALPHRASGFFLLALAPVGRVQAPLGPGLMPWGSQMPKIWVELAEGTVLCTCLLVGRGPERESRPSLGLLGPGKVDNCDFLSFHSMH